MRHPGIDHHRGLMVVTGPAVDGEQRLDERFETGGLRLTPRRRHVYSVLLRKRDHPTAEEVFIRAKREMPGISLATVYNCLDALVRCGLVREVTLERRAARYCANMEAHGHFYCDRCENVFDVDLAEAGPFRLPKGFRADRFEVAIHGRCRACGDRRWMQRAKQVFPVESRSVAA